MMCMNRENKYQNLPFLLIGTVVFAVLIYAFSGGISGNDFWWHIKVGEYICENKCVPTEDIFSWIGMEKGISWTAHEWASEVVFYIIFKYSGKLGIFLLSLFSAALMLSFIAWRNRENIKNNILISAVFFVLLAVLQSSFFYGRPHLFGFFFLFAELKVLYDHYEDNGKKTIWAVPVIAALWSNFHGGSSVLAYVLPAIFTVVSLLELKFGRIISHRADKKQIILLAVITLSAVMGILINPVGLKVLTYPYTSFGDDLMMSVISEWRSPDAKSLWQLLFFFLPIFIMSIGFVSGKEDIRSIDIAVMCLFLLLFFRSTRFIMLWNIAAAFYAFRYMPQLKVKPIQKKFEAAVCAVFALLMLTVAGLGVKNTVKTVKKDALISVALEDEIVEKIRQDAPERIFNDYNYGETLIYNDIPVFFDARADLFAQEHIMEDGVTLMYLNPSDTKNSDTYADVEKLFEKYRIDSVVIYKQRALFSYLMAFPERYELVCENEQAAYFRVVSRFKK